MNRKAGLALVSMLALCPVATFAQGIDHLVEIEFSQLHLEYGGTEYLNSRFGSAAVGYYGYSDALYFNLEVNDEWVVRNLPLLSPDGKGVFHIMHVTFPITHTSGTPVLELGYSASLTDDVLAGPVAGGNTAPVIATWTTLGPNVAVPPVLNPAAPVGDKVVDSATIDGVENVECGNGECVPAAVAMSLKRLNEKHNLGIDAAKISTAQLVTVLGAPAGAGVNWALKKDAYMKRLKAPIETVYQLNSRFVNIADMAMTALKNDEAVELCTVPHCVKVIGMAKLANGTYSITYRHDALQGAAGGLKDETSIYNPATGMLAGGSPWIGGQALEKVVIERKKP
jgi:hypothetical protein